MNCLACAEPLAIDARLCDSCTRTLDGRLADLPAWYVELAEHLRPGASGDGGPVALVREAPLPVVEPVLDLRAEGGIVTVLEGWREAMQAARGWGRPGRAGTIEYRVMAAARGLRMSLDWIAEHFDGAGDLYDEVRTLTGACRAILDPDPDEQGPEIATCAAELANGSICGRPLRATGPDRATVRCRACGTEYTPSMWLTLATDNWAPTTKAAA